MENNQQYRNLMDMGCNPVLSEAAIKVTKSQDLSALIDWISDNSEKEDHWKEWLATQGNEPEKKEGGEATQSIDHLVKKEYVEQLMKLGHSKNVAQKSLLFTNNGSVKMAQNWIEEHKYDVDFQEEVFITGQEENQPKLTPEEARAKLKELTDKAREIRKKREEEEAREREKNRVRYGKEMIEAKRIAEEQAAKRQIQLDRIQKAKDEQYKKQLLEQMRMQKMERLGIKEEKGSSGPALQKKTEVKYSKVEQVEIQCEQVKVGNHAYPDKARTFFETAQIYVNNIIKNNGEEKFRKINKQNKAFQNRILEAFGGLETLLVIGYEQEGGFYVMRHFDLKELGFISKILERYISYYN